MNGRWRGNSETSGRGSCKDEALQLRRPSKEELTGRKPGIRFGTLARRRRSGIVKSRMKISGNQLDIRIWISENSGVEI